jgi:electron transfer flavoprotein beta subunit
LKLAGDGASVVVNDVGSGPAKETVKAHGGARRFGVAVQQLTERMGDMKIVVPVKHVPDATAPRSFAADSTVDRAAVPGLLSELDEYAVEQALRVVESGVAGEITFISMGPGAASEALRKALTMGGDAAVHVSDDALHGTDAPGTSLVLAKAIERLGFDLVICGMASTDGTMSVVPAMLAERLGVPQLTFASELTVTADGIKIRRDGDVATETVEAPLPAVVSVTDRTGEARYPSFKGIMAAKKKPTQTWSLSDLGIDPSEVGLSAAWSTVQEITARPARSGGQIIKDDGDAAARLTEFLAAQKFI